MYKPIHQNKINGLWINVLVVKSITITLETTTVFYDYFPVFDCWGDLILSEFQNQFCACSVQPGQKCELGFLFDAKIPAPLRVKYCVIVRGVDKGYIECLNKYNYVTVWFIVGRNIAIVPQKQRCHCRTIFLTPKTELSISLSLYSKYHLTLPRHLSVA